MNISIIVLNSIKWVSQTFQRKSIKQLLNSLLKIYGVPQISCETKGASCFQWNTDDDTMDFALWPTSQSQWNSRFFTHTKDAIHYAKQKSIYIAKFPQWFDRKKRNQSTLTPSRKPLTLSSLFCCEAVALLKMLFAFLFQYDLLEIGEGFVFFKTVCCPSVFLSVCQHYI